MITTAASISHQVNSSFTTGGHCRKKRRKININDRREKEDVEKEEEKEGEENNVMLSSHEKKVDTQTRYDFRYRKSIFATIFAICIIMAILFLMLYLRCYNFYIEAANAGKNCPPCPAHAHCSNENDDIFKCVCNRGYYDDERTFNVHCKNISMAIEFPRNKTNKMVHKLRLNSKSNRSNEFSFCTWLNLDPTKDIIPLTTSPRLNTILSFNYGARYFSISVNTTTLHISSRSKYTLDIPIALNRNQWTHMCVSINSTTSYGYMNVFLNGQIYKSLDIKHFYRLLDCSGVFQLGTNVKRKNEDFVGKLSQFYLTDRVLKDTDVAMFLSSRPPSTQHILINWSDLLSRSRGVGLAHFVI